MFIIVISPNFGAQNLAFWFGKSLINAAVQYYCLPITYLFTLITEHINGDAEMSPYLRYKRHGTIRYIH